MIEERYAQALSAFEALPAGAEEKFRSVYRNQVMPLALERLREIAANLGLEAKPVDLLFLTVGQQPYSVMLSLVLTPARFVAFLCTDESLANAEDALAFVFPEADARPPHEYAKVNRADPLSVYREILRIYRERNPASVIVDITSGTKAMTAAASSAAVVVGARQRYVESNPTKHRGWFAREQPHELPHPLVEMGDLQRREAERLFDRGDFAHAAVLFAELHERGAPGYRFAERAQLARAYAEIDSLRFADAVNTFSDSLFARLRNRGDSPDPLCAHADRLRRQRQRIEELAQGRPSDETLMRYLIAYARRRGKQGLFDAAALVHYRTIEMCIAARLTAHGIDKDAVTVAALSKAAQCSAADLLNRYNKDVAKPDYHLAEWPSKLGLAQGWTLLQLLNDDLAASIQANRLFGQIQARNQSIFAHGRSPLSAKSFADFEKLAEEIRQKTALLQSWALPSPDPEFDFVTF